MYPYRENRIHRITYHLICKYRIILRFHLCLISPWTCHLSQQKVPGGIKRMGQKLKGNYFAPGTLKLTSLSIHFFSTVHRRAEAPNQLTINYLKLSHLLLSVGFSLPRYTGACLLTWSSQRNIPHHRMSCSQYKLGGIVWELPVTAQGQPGHWSAGREHLFFSGFIPPSFCCLFCYNYITSSRSQ